MSTETAPPPSVDIAGLDKGLVLAALWNNSLSFGSRKMTAEEGRKIFDACEPAFGRKKYFDYVKGRVMKVDLSGDSFDPRLYDRDNGQGSAQYAIDSLR